MMIMIFFGGLFLGGFLGVAFMCLLFVNREQKCGAQEENKEECMVREGNG